MKKTALLVLSAALAMTPLAQAETTTIDLQLPTIGSGNYQRPYVAVWVERKGERRAVRTISVWYEDKKWLKDIRRWWRKAGRYAADLDGVTGATRAPGNYQLSWDGRDQVGQPLDAGKYTLYLEAVREHGNRTLLKQPITLGADTSQTYQVDAGLELGAVTVRIGE